MTTETTKNDRPVATFNEFSIEVTVWRNEGQYGPVYNIKSPLRRYFDKEAQAYKSTSSLKPAEALIGHRLLELAYEHAAELAAQDRHARLAPNS